MSVTAEIRRVALPAVKEGLETSCSNSGEGELLYGRLRRQGLNPRLATAIPAPERFGTSRHYPLYVTNSPFVKQTVDGVSDVLTNLDGVNGDAMAFETDVASGTVAVHIRGLHSTRAGIFEGKKRFVHVAMQLRVKRALPASSVCIGQEQHNDVLMPLWMRQLTLNTAAKAFSSTARVVSDGTPRYFMNPIVAACQLLNVSRPGEEPPLWEVPEDVRLMLPGAVDARGKPLPAEKRRKHCDVPANVASARLEPSLVYTFHFWQHYCSFSDYKLAVGWLNLDCAVFMNRCPLALTVKDVDSGEYLFSVLAWHERLLYSAAANCLLDGNYALGPGAHHPHQPQQQQQPQQPPGPAAATPGVGAKLLSGMGRIFSK